MPRSFPRLAASRLRALTAGVAGKRQRLAEDRCEIAAVKGGADGGLVRHGGSRDEIAPPQLCRIDAGDARGFLDHALEHVVRLRPPGAAIGGGRHRVGEGAAHADVDVPDVVHAGQAAAEAQARNRRADRAEIGAEVGGVADAQRQEAPALVKRQLRLGIVVARLVVAEERLGAAGHPMDRPAELFRAEHQREVFRIGPGLEAEGAADVLGQHPQPLLRHFEDDGDIVAQDARALRADAQRILVVRRIIACGGAARLHRGDRDALIGHRNARDEFGGLEDRVDLARIGLGIGGKSGPVDGQVARRLRPDLRRAGDERGAGVGYPRQRLVVDGDEFGGVLRRGGALADDHRDRLTDMHDPRRGERRPVRRDQRLAAAAGERWMRGRCCRVPRRRSR